MTEPNPLTARLQALTASIIGAVSPNSLSDVHAALEAILGPQGAQTSLNTLLTQLTRDGLADLKSLYDASLLVQAAVEGLRGTNDATLSSLLTESQYDTQSALMNGILLDIKACVCETRTLMRSLVYGGLYDDLPGDEVSSGGSLMIEGRRFAVFTQLPTGVTAVDGGTTLLASDWSTYEMLIQTTDPAPRIAGDTVAPGTWIPLSGTANKSASVGAQYPITAYLRSTLVIPTEPYVMWEGTNVLPVLSPNPNYPNDKYYCAVTVPPWADRVQIRVGAQNCFGNMFLIQEWGAPLLWVLYNGCNNSVVNKPGGATLFAYNGTPGFTASGTVWALAPGVNPVP